MNKFITHVIRMPDSPESRAAITNGIRDLVETHGGMITGQSLEDEMTLLEMFEKRLSEPDVVEARQEAAEIMEEGMSKSLSVKRLMNGLAESAPVAREPTKEELAQGTVNTTLRLDPVDRVFVESQAAHYGISVQKFISMMIRGLRCSALQAKATHPVEPHDE